MIERAFLVGGPQCGAVIENPTGRDEVEIPLAGGKYAHYHRVSAVPNWMVNPAFRPAYPRFLYEPYYHDIEVPGSPAGAL